MIPRDWTTTDAAGAADAEADRNWWRKPLWSDDYPDPEDHGLDDGAHDASTKASTGETIND